MEFTGIALITTNVPRLCDFYGKILQVGFEGDDVHAELNVNGAGIAIFSEEGMEQMAPGSMKNAGRGAVTVSFQVEDVDLEYERIKELGVEFVMLPKSHPWGSRSFWFRDPDENIVNFFCRIDV